MRDQKEKMEKEKEKEKQRRNSIEMEKEQRLQGLSWWKWCKERTKQQEDEERRKEEKKKKGEEEKVKGGTWGGWGNGCAFSSWLCAILVGLMFTLIMFRMKKAGGDPMEEANGGEQLDWKKRVEFQEQRRKTDRRDRQKRSKAVRCTLVNGSA